MPTHARSGYSAAMTYMRYTAAAALVAALSLAACSGVQSSTGADVAAPQGSAPTASAVPPGAPAADMATVTGPVLETMDSGGYTYARLQTGNDEVWIAATQFAVTPGERLTVALESPMHNFQSRTLGREFPLIYFVSQVAREGEAAAPRQLAPMPLMGSREPAAAAAPVERIAPAAGSLSIADVWAQRASLAGKAVVVRGKVVKVNGGIMDRNWVHLQDGSGSAADRTNDLTVTTAAEVNVGDVVTMSGVLATGKDFGAGYAYDAILEQATVR